MDANTITRHARARNLGAATVIALALGCGTTRMTDTQRTGTEQLLISHAIDESVSRLDFRALADKPVYFDAQYLDGAVDKGYLVSSLRQHLLASGCLLQEERSKATYVVEARSGGIGTDRHQLLVGIPQTTVPAIVPGQPTQIPEIPFAKKTDQNAVAKIAVFAYNRTTGQPVWQSGVVQSVSSARDIWVLGTGPFQNGSIRDRTEFAGEPIPFSGKAPASAPEQPLVPVTQAAAWPEKSTPAGPTTIQLVVTPDTAPALRDAIKAVLTGSPKPSATPAVSSSSATGSGSGGSKPAAPNVGGVDETQPAQVLNSGLGGKPGK